MDIRRTNAFTLTVSVNDVDTVAVRLSVGAVDYTQPKASDNKAYFPFPTGMPTAQVNALSAVGLNSLDEAGPALLGSLTITPLIPATAPVAFELVLG